MKYRLYKSFKTYAPNYLKWCIRKIERKYVMLKISRVARHTVVQMGPCHRCTLNACGPLFRDY